MNFDESQLIFIISQPRAGSTFLQAVLSNHEFVDTVSEHWMLLPFLSIYKPSLIQAKYDYKLSADAFWDFIDKNSSKHLFEEEIKEFLLMQYSKISTNPQNKVLDKTPRYYEIFDEIYELFPSAKFIILKRHPVAVLRSIMKTWSRYSFKGLRPYYRDIFKAPHIMQEISKKYCNESNCRILFYEDLIKRPQLKIKELYDWIEIPFSNDVLDVSSNNKYIGKYGDQTGIKKNKQPDKGGLVQWKDDLKNRRFTKLLNGYGHYLGKDFLKEYGYNDKIKYLPNLKFKLFKYYCLRQDYIKNFKVKDLLIQKIISSIYKEDI